MRWTGRFVAAATISASTYKTLTYTVLITGLLVKVFERGRKRLRDRCSAGTNGARFSDCKGSAPGDKSEPSAGV